MSEGTFKLRAKPLSLNRLPEAWPLCRALRSGLQRDAWERFAIKLSSKDICGDAGIVVAEDERGTFHGLFSYQVDREAPSKAQLVVDIFAALGLILASKRLVASILAESMERRALACCCCCVCLMPRTALFGQLELELHEFMRSRGYHHFGPDLRKELRL